MDNQLPETGASRHGFIKRIMQVFSSVAISGVVLFLLAGRLDWWWGWVYIGLWMLTMLGTAVIVERHNPGHIASRSEKPKNTAKWDEIFMRLYTLSSFAVLIVAALDAGRFEWTSLPLWLHVLGVGVGVLASSMSIWSMSSNRFTRTHAAIQEDEGQYVVKAGPYAIIRHPMYSASVLMWVGIPLVLGSVWSLIPAVLSILLVVARTSLEDRMLFQELAGYREYCQEVRFRLIPGVW